jgi:hypothetical protein
VVQTFKKLCSSEFYNFETDRIAARIPKSALDGYSPFQHDIPDSRKKFDRKVAALRKERRWTARRQAREDIHVVSDLVLACGLRAAEALRLAASRDGVCAASFDAEHLRHFRVLRMEDAALPERILAARGAPSHGAKVGGTRRPTTISRST